jgi:hypothetical protein
MIIGVNVTIIHANRIAFVRTTFVTLLTDASIECAVKVERFLRHRAALD